MSSAIETVSRAIRFDGPDYLPLELVDVPGLYDAYGTLDPASVSIPPGAERFDSAWATYHWTFSPLGTNDHGEILRQDEWGCRQRIPAEPTSTYAVETHPLGDVGDLDGYSLPDPSVTTPFFDRVSRTIRELYPDRFICAYVDPGPFLIAFNLMGYDGLLARLADDPTAVQSLIERIFAYQKQIVTRWKAAGAHMVNLIDEFAGTQGVMFSPALWRDLFKPLFTDFLQHIRDQGLFTGLLLDGNVEVLFDDFLEMPIDVIQFAQPLNVGLGRISDRFAGVKCVKASVDMMQTLATGTPGQVRQEARELVERFHTDRGGFIAVALRWHRPEYPAENVRASIETFNEFRQEAR